MAGCNIATRTVLSQPHTHIYGQQEPVSGAIHLKHDSTRAKNPLPDCELQVDVHAVLCGHAMSKIWADSRRKRLLHAADVPLFSRKLRILRDVSHPRTNCTLAIPFSIMFPRTTEANLTSLLWQDGSKDIYNGSPEHPLPPSTFARSSHAARPFLAVVEYAINTRISIRYADSTSIYPSRAESFKIYYEGGQIGSLRIPRDIQTHNSRIHVNDQGSSDKVYQVRRTRSRLRSIVSSMQHDFRSIEIVCHIPRRLEVGHHNTCILSLRDVHDPHQDPAELPILYLKYARLDIYQTMHVRTERLAGDMLETSQQTWLLDMDFMIDPCEPFHAGARHTKTISTSKMKDIPVSFATYNVARSFHAVVKICIGSPTCTRTIGFEQPIEICSGIVAQDVTAFNRDSLLSDSQQNASMHFSAEQGQCNVSDEVLPTYEEAVARV